MGRAQSWVICGPRETHTHGDPKAYVTCDVTKIEVITITSLLRDEVRESKVQKM